MKLGIVNILQLLLVFQSLVFASFLISQGRGKRISNVLLAGFLFVLAVHMLCNFVFELNLAQGIPDITSSFGFLYGPFLFFYIKSLVYKEFQLKLANLFHLSPWAMMAVASQLISVRSEVSGTLILISISFYLFRSFQLIRHFHRIIRNTQSRFDGIALIWMQRFLYGLIIIVLIDGIHNLVAINSLTFENLFYGILIAALLFFVTSLVFNGLRQPEIFQGVTLEDEKLLIDASTSYSSSKLQQHEIEKIANSIQSYFTEHHPYQDPELNIQKLAEQLDLSSRLVSEVINRHFEQNFSDFVNSFRILKATEMLRDGDEKMTVLEILYAVGFNSKSSFYTAFKFKTGMTPSEFKKGLQ